MDFSNEPYVRVYTRDTTNWRRMGWNGQCVLLQLLRKVDRSGSLELDGLEPWEAVMLAIGCTEEVARDGVGKLLFLKTAVVRGDLLVLPNHIKAQEAVKSDKLRQKESRERRAAGHQAQVTNRDEPSQNVTESHDSGRVVTPEPESSQPVTNGHSLLCSALPCSASQGSADPLARGVESEPQSTPPPEPERGGAPPPPSGSGGAWQEVELGFSSAYSAAGVGKMPVLSQGKRDLAVEHCRGLVKMYHRPLYDVAQAVSIAAKPGSKSWDFDIAKVDPYAPAPAQTGAFPARAGRMAPSRGTTAEDYRDAPSLAEQRAEAQRRRAAANGT